MHKSTEIIGRSTVIIIIFIKNECHSNIVVDKLQGCGHDKKLRESKSESRSSKVVWQGAVSVVRTLEQCSFQAASKNVQWLRRLHCRWQTVPHTSCSWTERMATDGHVFGSRNIELGRRRRAQTLPITVIYDGEFQTERVLMRKAFANSIAQSTIDRAVICQIYQKLKLNESKWMQQMRTYQAPMRSLLKSTLLKKLSNTSALHFSSQSTTSCRKHTHQQQQHHNCIEQLKHNYTVTIYIALILHSTYNHCHILIKYIKYSVMF